VVQVKRAIGCWCVLSSGTHTSSFYVQTMRRRSRHTRRRHSSDPREARAAPRVRIQIQMHGVPTASKFAGAPLARPCLAAWRREMPSMGSSTITPPCAEEKNTGHSTRMQMSSAGPVTPLPVAMKGGIQIQNSITTSQRRSTECRKYG
jgi:hypothetical protein